LSNTSSTEWYVHTLGPDDIEGPFASHNAAVQHAMNVNVSLWTGRAASEHSPHVWAVPTRNPLGIHA
jgi:hypothetical protein